MVLLRLAAAITLVGVNAACSADARTDIFALGVLIHEMVSGKKVFEGKSRVLLMSAIATTEPPPLSTIEPATPPALEHVVRTCLAIPRIVALSISPPSRR